MTYFVSLLYSGEEREKVRNRYLGYNKEMNENTHLIKKYEFLKYNWLETQDNEYQSLNSEIILKGNDK